MMNGSSSNNIKGDNDTANSTGDGSNSNCNSSREDRIVESIYEHIIQSICIDVAGNMHELIKTDGGSMGGEGAIPSSWKLFTRPTVPTRRELYPELYSSSNNNTDGISTITTDEEIQAVLEKYAVDLPPQQSMTLSSVSSGKKRRGTAAVTVEEEDRLVLKKKYKDSSDDDDDDYDDDDDDKDEEYKMEEDDDDDDDDDEAYVPDAGGGNKKQGRSTDAIMSSTEGETGATNTSTNAAASTTTTKNNEITSVVTPTDIWGNNPAKESKTLCRCRLCGRLISTARFANHLDKCMGLSTRPLASEGKSVMMNMPPSSGGGGVATAIKKSKRKVISKKL